MADKVKRDFNFDIGEDVAPLLPGKRKRGEDTDLSALTGQALGEAHAAGAVTTVTMPAVTDDGGVDRRTVWVANRIWNAVGERAVREGRTKSYFVLLGLQKLGFPVTEADLEDKRGSFLREAARERKAKQGQ